MSSTIPQEIIELNFPDLSSVIVIGGAYLELLGVRSAGDIDLAVSKINWEYLRNDLGWSVHTKGESLYMRDPAGRFDAWRGWYDREHQRIIEFDELLKNSLVHHQGFRVPTVEYQIQLKRWDGRQKDLEDIALLERIA